MVAPRYFIQLFVRDNVVKIDWSGLRQRSAILAEVGKLILSERVVPASSH